MATGRMPPGSARTDHQPGGVMVTATMDEPTEPTDYDGNRVEKRQQYDWEETDPSVAVIETLAATTGREPTALDVLFDHVDPEALDALIRSSVGTEHEADTLVGFAVEGYRVTVSGDGYVSVSPQVLGR